MLSACEISQCPCVCIYHVEDFWQLNGYKRGFVDGGDEMWSTTWFGFCHGCVGVTCEQDKKIFGPKTVLLGDGQYQQKKNTKKICAVNDESCHPCRQLLHIRGACMCRHVSCVDW